MFPDLAGPNYDAYFAFGPGAFTWRDLGDGEALAIVLPGSRGPHALYPCHAIGNWARRGPDCGWDGNRLRPTLTPSILSTQGDGWHGYLTAGVLRSV